MATLTGLHISQSYGGVVHLTTNTGIVGGTFTQLQDGFGTDLGLQVNGSAISASFTGSLNGTASYASNANSASFASTATSASFATSASYVLNAISASFAVSSSRAVSSSFATTAISSSYALSASFAPSQPINTSSLATTGSNTFVGNQTITGSVKGNVTALTITSQTASLDWNTGNYFTLTLVSGSTTRLNFTNIQRGQVINLQVQQATTSGGNLSFPSIVTFPTGSAYTASIAANDVDLLTFISFDGTNVRAVPAKLFQ